MVRKKRLGDMLIEFELLTEEQLLEALAEQKTTHKKLGRLLIEKGFISEEDLFHVLEMQYNIPYFDLNSNYIDPKIPKLVPQKLAEMHVVIPVAFKDNKIALAMSDPLDIIAVDDVRMASGMDVEVYISSENDIKRAISKYYDQADSARKAAQEFIGQNQVDELKDILEETEDVTNSPMVRLVNTIISQAVKQRVSDIHIEPFEEIVRIRYRLDGSLFEVMSPDKNTHSGIVTRVKIMGGMNISERRIPQDGRVETVIDGFPIDMRISILPTVYGEKIVIRILDRTSSLMPKEKLGFSEDNMKRLNSVLKVPEGIILITGPTGSGKTTTLYSILREYNKIDTNIITVEDPVEYRLEGINQVQTNSKAGLTFATGLRSILRQDPDIVMVGEIRDSETAEIAIRAAITGHIVLSTLHTNDAASTLARLVDMGVENFMVATAVKGVLAQRLVKRICRKCAYAYEPSPEERKILGIPDGVKAKVKKGKGCNACNKSGYQGRIAIHEVLLVDDTIQSLMLQNKSVDYIKKAAKESGMATLNDSCVELVRQGVTTVDEVLRVTYQLEI